MNASKWIATAIGALALLFWSLGAVLVVAIGQLPIFEIQSIIFFSSFLLSFFRISFNRRWHIITKVPMTMWIVGVMGIYFANLFFVSAFGFAPPEKVDLINYLWPIMVILLSPIILEDKLKGHHLAGVGIAFFGIFILLTDGNGLVGFEYQYWLGYLLSFCNAICWTLYVLVSKRYPQVPNEIIGCYAGVAAICSFVCHLIFESFVMPSIEQWSMLILLGLTGQGLAYLFWDHGIKKGYYKLLCALTYASPIISILLLVHFEFVEMSQYLINATMLVTLGAFVTTTQFPQLVQRVPKLISAFSK